jgi:adenine/guanine phosphoribosyltransferase-like PRPP-binding protein
MARPTKIARGYIAAPFDHNARSVAIDVARMAQDVLGFDTVVVTGVSGTLMGGVIAHALGCHLLVVRKEDDKSTHSWHRTEGDLGSRWVFLDDFTETGATRSRVRRIVRELARERDIATTNAGSVLYESGDVLNGNDKPVDL